jgi:hypothetical protein
VTTRSGGDGLARRSRPLHEESCAGRRELWVENRSVKLSWIRPAGKAGNGVELSKETSHQLVCIIFRAQLIELSKHEGQRAVRIGDRTFREVLTLPLETFAVPDELLAIEVGRKTKRDAQNPIWADDACHATPRVGHLSWMHVV